MVVVAASRRSTKTKFPTGTVFSSRLLGGNRSLIKRHLSRQDLGSNLLLTSKPSKTICENDSMGCQRSTHSLHPENLNMFGVSNIGASKLGSTKICPSKICALTNEKNSMIVNRCVSNSSIADVSTISSNGTKSSSIQSLDEFANNYRHTPFEAFFKDGQKQTTECVVSAQSTDGGGLSDVRETVSTRYHSIIEEPKSSGERQCEESVVDEVMKTSSRNPTPENPQEVPTANENCTELVVTPSKTKSDSTQISTSRLSATSALAASFQLDSNDGYIITPGKHKIYISSFLMQNDSQNQRILSTTTPALAAMSNYAQDMYTKWRQVETSVDKQIFQLSFRPGTDIEKFRRTAVHFVLRHVHEWSLSSTTAHCSVQNINRMLLHFVHPVGKPLTTNMFVGTVFACLRMAVKHEEVPEKVRPLRNSPSSVCNMLGVQDPYLKLDISSLNSAEQDVLKILGDPIIVPSGLDYLERYLTVGGWPEHLLSMYRELALYLINLSLFSRKDIDLLAGLPPSLISASALSLGIRVISAGRDEAYECWPKRLSVYTGYELSDLRQGVRGLSALLRTKPEGSEVLEKFHPVWATYDWK